MVQISILCVITKVIYLNTIFQRFVNFQQNNIDLGRKTYEMTERLGWFVKPSNIPGENTQGFLNFPPWVRESQPNVFHGFSY
jgi:hypothetical protein